MKISQNVKLLFLACTFLTLVACAKTEPVVQVPTVPFSEAEAEKRWQDHIDQTPKITPYKAEGSLRFGVEGKTNRVSYILWSNEESPVRLDILSPIGPLALIYEGKIENSLHQDDVQFFIPSEKTLYLHQNTIIALNVLGINVPFNLYSFRKIFQGIYPMADEGYYYTNAYPLANSDNYMYDVSYNIKSFLGDSNNTIDTADIVDPQMGTWTLDRLARPVQFSFQGWDILFSYKEENRNPYKISGKQMNGNIFTLFVNKNSVEERFADESFKINIPEDAKIINLQEVKTIY